MSWRRRCAGKLTRNQRPEQHRLATASSVAKSFFDCEQQLADFERRLEREKLDTMKELAYGASHEINNPHKASIAARAETLLDDGSRILNGGES